MRLANENIHLYYCDMRRFPVAEARLFALLNKSDQLRYRGFKNKTRQRQFAMARWLIKHVLDQQFGLEVSHDYQLLGYTHWQVVGSELIYPVSISHSGHYIAVAIAGFSCAIGIDIEQHKPRNYTELLKMFSTDEEQRLISSFADQQRMFYRLWTAKEAFLKVTQCAIERVHKEQLSACLLHDYAQVSGYYSQSGNLAKGTYSYCVMTDIAGVMPIQAHELPYPFVEP
ncbi:MAG: 4'-phosphopantetheinyl transferase superfamily protein [Opitutaceae bacterium]|nr:4'-phosphopantetheinyl transferase superfamily protein [Opitutaceae bacterium]